MAPEPAGKSERAAPWATVLVAVAAGLALAVRPLEAAFPYERGAILAGEIWRAWTGHLAHFGPAHLVWNLAVLLPAGCWLERLNPARVRWFYLACPPLVSVTLLVFDPALARYAGLSGLATGVLVLLACRQLLVRPDEPEWIWLGVLGLVAAKIVLETFTGRPLLAEAHRFRAVPLAHLAGAVCGVLFATGLRREFYRLRART